MRNFVPKSTQRLPILTLLCVSFAGVLLTFMGVTAAAQSPQLDQKRLPQMRDFLYLQSLTVDGTRDGGSDGSSDGSSDVKAAAYRFTIPEPMYESVGFNEFSHIGIFNEQGDLVPWRIETPAAQTYTADRIIPLTLFDGEQKRRPGGVKQHLSIEQGRDNVTLELMLDTATPSDDKGRSARRDVYYIDLTDVDDRRDLSTLYFKWEPPQDSANVAQDNISDIPDSQEGANFAVDVSISNSSDFKDWRLLKSGRLVNFQQGNAELRIQQMALQNLTGPYLRIQLASESRLPKLASVTGHIKSKGQIRVPEQWKSAELIRLESQPGYEFETTGNYVVTRLRIRSSIDNSLGEVTLFAFQNSRWVQLSHAKIAQLGQGESASVGTVIDVPSRSARQWRLVFSHGSAGYLSAEPTVEYAYAPREIVFVRQGGPQFTLAYGVPSWRAVQLTWPNWVNHPLFPKQQQQSDGLILGEISQQVVEPGSQEEESARPFFSTPSFLFWFGAIIFIAVLLALAIYLIKEMKLDSNSKGNEK